YRSGEEPVKGLYPTLYGDRDRFDRGGREKQGNSDETRDQGTRRCILPDGKCKKHKKREEDAGDNDIWLDIVGYHILTGDCPRSRYLMVEPHEPCICSFFLLSR